MLIRLLAVVALFAWLDRAHGQIPMDLLRGPLCGMVDPRTKAQVAVSPTFTRVNVVVTDAIAQAVVTQTFVNPFNAVSEAVYLFPLPDQGSVHGMRYQYRDSLYVAQIMERARAEQKYDSIKAQGGQAALLLQDKPNIFQQRVANIGAGETAHVEIRLSLALKYVDGELELAFPTLIGPRFGSDQPAYNGSWNPPENRAGPGFQFNVLVQSGVDLSSITSPSHPVTVGELGVMKTALVERQVMGPEAKTTAGFSRGVLLQTAQTYPNRDYVLRMKRAKVAHDFSMATYRNMGDVGTPAGGTAPGYFMLSLYPDPDLFAGSRPDLELVLMVDVSGSQAGWPLDREKEISLNILSRLTPDDDLTVLSFSDRVQYAFGSQTPAPATRANLATAETFIRGLAVQGGTQLLNAVNQCLAIPRKSDKRRYYIFLTDGFITNETAILEAIRNHPSQPTIFTFGAGNNLNRFFLEECAKVGNGFATPLVQGDAAGPAVEAAWSRLAAPQLENIQVDFGGLDVTEAIWPASRILYKGLPFRVLGKYSRGGAYTVTLSADQNGRPVTLSRVLNVAADDALAWSVSKLWARERIGRLMLEQGTTESNKAAVIAVSVEHQVLSSYTAFLASQPQAVGSGGIGGPGNPVEISRDGRPTVGSDADRFELSVRGGLLRLDFAGPTRVEAVRIYDLHGRLLFTYRPKTSRTLLQWLWDGRDERGKVLPRGRYLVSVQTAIGPGGTPGTSAAAGIRTRLVDWNPGP